MKKLLLGATLIFGTFFSAEAQITIMSQPFATASMPVGWTQNTPAVATDGWIFNNTYGPNMLNRAGVPTQGFCAYVDDWDNNPSQTTPNWDTLKSPIINCSTYAHVFITLNYMFWQDDGNETGTIAVSTNGGLTWRTAVNLLNTTGGWANGYVYDISSFIGGQANAMIAFTYYDGFATQTNGYVAVGMCIQDVVVSSPLNYDLSVVSVNNPVLMQVGKSYNFTGAIDNFGGDSVVSMDMNYSVNNGTPNHFTISGIAGFNALTGYTWSDGNTFSPPSAGLYTVKFWADNLNGGFMDENHSNDTISATFTALDSLTTRQALYEEQTGQSCVYCMLAAPNMDTVFANNATTSNLIRYHVPIPNRDYMYDANVTPCNARLTYYGVTGAPWGDLDGAYFYPGGDYYGPTQRYSSTTVQGDNAAGSPISIKITSAQYDAATDSFYVSADITAISALPANLTAQVALTIDSITYQYDLSYDNPITSFAPPLGALGGYPDSYYQYVMKFTHVLEEMFPNSGAGKNLPAFSAGQTQTVSYGWKKNHPWGALDSRAAYRDSEYYDSSSTGQFVVFVQTNNAIPSLAIPAQYIFQSASAPVTGMVDLGMKQISDGVSFAMYPNPTSNNTTLAFSLTKDQNVDVEVYNMLGDVVYSANQGILSSGQHTVMLNGSSLSNGVYMVRIITNGAATTQKLVIQK